MKDRLESVHLSSMLPKTITMHSFTNLKYHSKRCWLGIALDASLSNNFCREVAIMWKQHGSLTLTLNCNFQIPRGWTSRIGSNGGPTSFPKPPKAFVNPKWATNIVGIQFWWHLVFAIKTPLKLYYQTNSTLKILFFHRIYNIWPSFPIHKVYHSSGVIRNIEHIKSASHIKGNIVNFDGRFFPPNQA